MRRTGNLFEKIVEMENLRLAFWKARQGKNGKEEVLRFRADLDGELTRLQEELMDGSWRPGDFHVFEIRDPKVRTICAAPFRDRVLHHALMNVCEPVFERYQIYDSYACRKGKGLHVCLERAQGFTREHAWYLKLDVRKYFDSIPHDVLMVRLERRVKDRRLLELFGRIIASHANTPGRGIPIGNLTSQFFANDYLAGVDHWVKEERRVKGYVRYMDDLVLWGGAREALKALDLELRDKAEDLGMMLKPPQLNRCRLGVPMLGFRVFGNRLRLSPRSRERFVRKLRHAEGKVLEGEWDEAEAAAHVEPLLAFVCVADSLSFRKSVLEKLGTAPEARTA